MNWNQPIANQNAFHRAAGRRKLNAARRREKLLRKALLLRIMLQYFHSGGKLSDRGIQKQIALSSGLARSTVCQYFRELQSSLDIMESLCRSCSIQISVKPDGIKVTCRS